MVEVHGSVVKTIERAGGDGGRLVGFPIFPHHRLLCSLSLKFDFCSCTGAHGGCLQLSRGTSRVYFFAQVTGARGAAFDDIKTMGGSYCRDNSSISS